ncbi:MAG: heavy metal translocating P-type ATPase metal-binding domain-containing protein [Bdellovibrionales bacterium]|nr:heavy metal translocating P-type ATPase metal-binding domain-containing protein [Bdellovibrionales bacterium]
MISQPAIQHKCVHCGLHFRYEAGLTPSQDYCCWGCKTVYEILTKSGLQKFYDIKANGVCFAPPLPALSGSGHFTHWDSKSRDVQIFVGGVHCSACLWLLEQIPKALPEDVLSARLDIGRSLLYVQLSNIGAVSRVGELIRSWGYRPQLVNESREIQELQKNEVRSQILELGIAGALAGNIMLMSLGVYAGAAGGVATLFDWVAGLLAIPVVFYSGRSLFVNVKRSITQKYFSIDAPILLAILVAFFWSWANLLQGQHELYFDSLSSLVFLILASRYVLNQLRRFDLHASGSVLKEGSSLKVSVGDLVMIDMNQELSFDGVIRTGSVFVDQSFLTGESLPVRLNKGDIMYAGSQVLGFGEKVDGTEGDIQPQVEVVAVGSETRLAKMVEQIKNTKGQSSRVEKLYDRLAQGLMILVCFVGFALFAWHAYHGQWQAAFSRTMALFIVTCPCALAFATPLNVSFALRRALRLGLVIKNPDVFELGQKIKNIYFDKTGTLTITSLKVESNSIPENEWPNLRALVSRSRHPMSRAIMSDIGLGVMSTCVGWREIIGLGVEANVAGHLYELKKSQIGESSTRPSVDFFKNGELLGQVFLSNALRSDAPSAISSLQKQNYNLSILSGDRQGVVNSVAMELKLKSDQAFGDLLPEDKAQYVLGEGSLFVGDGINDALALKTATVGIAMHGGLESALENSSMYMVRSDLNLVDEYLQLSRKVRKIHIVNFIYSTLYNLISGGLAIFGFMNPLVAAIVMPLSATSVFVYTYFAYRNERSMAVRL